MAEAVAEDHLDRADGVGLQIEVLSVPGIGLPVAVVIHAQADGDGLGTEVAHLRLEVAIGGEVPGLIRRRERDAGIAFIAGLDRDGQPLSGAGSGDLCGAGGRLRLQQGERCSGMGAERREEGGRENMRQLHDGFLFVL